MLLNIFDNILQNIFGQTYNEKYFMTPFLSMILSIFQVQEAWSGLGYYSRARRLHEAADFITNKLDGEMPRTSADLLKLPGAWLFQVDHFQTCDWLT